MICPRCGTALTMSNAQNVEIDYCPNCRGVWLDRGELEKIIERSNAYGSQNLMGENREYGHHDSHDSHDKHDKHGYGFGNQHDSHGSYGNNPRRKKGFLSDLFDF